MLRILRLKQKKKEFLQTFLIKKRVYEKGVLKNFAKFTTKDLCQSLFFNKVA